MENIWEKVVPWSVNAIVSMLKLNELWRKKALVFILKLKYYINLCSSLKIDI